MSNRKTGSAADPAPSPANAATAPRKGGRPPIERDEAVARRVSSWVACGVSIMHIAALERLSPTTLRRLYLRELELGAAQANGVVAMALYRAATDANHGDWRAAYAWLRCRAGWVEATSEADLGKKELAEVMGKVAQKGTDWEKLLR